MSNNRDEQKLTWEQIYPDVMRKIVIQEIEDELFTLERMNHIDISLICYQQVYKSIEGFMLEQKKLHSQFRRVVYNNDLSQHVKYIEDIRLTYKWQINVWKRINKMRPGKFGQGAVTQQPAHGLSPAGQNNMAFDAPRKLDLTKQIKEMDVVDNNYALAWQRLEAVDMNFKGSNFSGNSKKFYIICEQDTLYSSIGLKFTTIHDKINSLKNIKRCYYCSKKSHCTKSGHIASLCFDKENNLSCNKSLNVKESADESEDTALSRTCLIMILNSSGTLFANKIKGVPL